MTDDMGDEANLTHPWATKYRIPLISTLWPRWGYEVALVVPDDGDLYAATWPTEQEASVIGSYIDYRRSYYRPSWAARMLREPLDVDPTTNTVILLRRAEGWCYRRGMWTIGPSLVPSSGDDDAARAQYAPTVSGLVVLLDRVNDGSSSWEVWKTGHLPALQTVDSD